MQRPNIKDKLTATTTELAALVGKTEAFYLSKLIEKKGWTLRELRETFEFKNEQNISHILGKWGEPNTSTK